MGLFERLFGRKAAVGPAPSPAVVAVPNATAPAPAAVPPPALSREEVLEALQLELPAQPPAPADPALVARILEEFLRTRPVPASPPQLAMRILNLIAEPDPDPNALAKLIALEPALTASVLRLASSAVNRGVEKIENLRDAITRLGMREVANVCGALSARSVFAPKRRAEQAKHGAAFAELFVHASATALAASALAFSMPKLKVRSDVVFLSALLHDIGMSVGLGVLAGFPAESVPAMGKDELQTVLDAVHGEIGVEIHREWKLPEAAQQICQQHHHSGAALAGAGAELHLVRLTSAVQLLLAFPANEARVQEALESAQALGLSRFALRSFAGDVRRFIETARSLGNPG